MSLVFTPRPSRAIHATASTSDWSVSPTNVYSRPAAIDIAKINGEKADMHVDDGKEPRVDVEGGRGMPVRKRTQQDQDKEDEAAHKNAMKELVQSWMDRLQLISVLACFSTSPLPHSDRAFRQPFFAAMEAQLLGNSAPSGNTPASITNQVANIGLICALIVHSFAAIISFLAAFVLIRFKLTEEQEELEAEGLPYASPTSVAGQTDTREKEQPSFSPMSSQSASVTVSQLVPPMQTAKRPRPIFSTNPHIEQLVSSPAGRSIFEKTEPHAHEIHENQIASDTDPLASSMSKSSTASAPKIPSQLPLKSAWARGPPQSTPTASSSRSQSPAPSNANALNGPANSHPNPTHSRRPSALGQGVSIKDGVSIPRNTASAVKSGSAVTFGSIDDAAAPISSSPASAPIVKSENVKSFGSVVVENGVSTAASKSALTSRPASLASPSPSSSAMAPPSTVSPIPKINKKDIAKLFQGPSTASKPQTETASPSTRPISLPPQPHQGPSQGQSYTPPTFTPSASFRGQAQNGSGSGGPPRSPVYSRPMVNGTSGGVGVSGRPSTGPGGPGGGPASPSRDTGWSSTFGRDVASCILLSVRRDARGTIHSLLSSMGSTFPSATSTTPSSTRSTRSPSECNADIAAQPSPTLTSSRYPHTNSCRSSFSSPTAPSIASTPKYRIASAHPIIYVRYRPRLNINANAYVPGKKVSIRDSTTGQEVNLEALKRSQSGAAPLPPASPIGFNKQDRKRTSSIRIESPEQKQQRLESEQKRLDVEQKRLEAEQEKERKEKKKEKEDKERKEKEERERVEAEARERAEREKKEAAERAQREREEERKKEEEEERIRKEKEAEEERKRKEEEEEKERIRQQEEQKRLEEEERVRQEEERKAKEAAEKAAAAAAAAAAEEAEVIPATAAQDVEDGEIEDIEKQTGEDSREASKPAAELSRAKSPEKENLRIDTAVHHLEQKRRPGPLNLATTASINVPAPLPSALATARIIEDIGTIQYPEGVKSPRVDLNVNAQKGKFRYDRDFLLQFMSICKEKPDNLPPLDAIGLDPNEQPSSYSMTRGGSGRRPPSGMVTPGGTSRQGSIGLGFIPSSLSGKTGPGNAFIMGQFSTTNKLTSEERFAMASGRSVSTSGAGIGMPVGVRPSSIVRTASQGGPGKERERIRSRRGEKRSEGTRISVTGHPSMSGAAMSASNMGPPLEPVAPLEASANRWIAGSTRRGQPADTDTPEVVDRKVKGLLNKLTMERFDSISDQIISWANKSEKETDGRTLIQVIRLVFEKATDEATFSEMYARLCRKMMEQISSKVQDDGIKTHEGKPIAGGQLFRKYLLNRCQEDFERGWVAKEATAAAAATKATEDQAVKDAQDKSKEGEGELYSEEYYAAQKAKRRGLGLIRFIGELFKLQMLTERIMHECIKKLLGNVENPEEEEIESLCKLLSTVGQSLDTQKAHAHMDVYFSRMKELCKSQNVNSRMQFMLQASDVIELRERRWIPRNKGSAPATIAQIHEAAAKEKAAQEKESFQRMNISRGGSRRGGERGDYPQIGPDGWSVAGSGPARPPPKAGDLSQFGKINKTTPMTFGPSGVFAGKKDKGQQPISRTTSSSNMFSMLSTNLEIATEVTTTKSSRPPSRKASVDLGQAAVPEASTGRRKLNLLPRSKPLEEQTKAEATPTTSEVGSDDEHGDSAVPPSMSEAEAKKKIEEDVKEFFSIKMLDEAESYFSSLPLEHRFRLVDKLVLSAVELKQPDAELVAKLFSQVREKDLCTPAAFEEGFMGLAEVIDDVAIDAPMAFKLMAMMMKGAGLDTDEERRLRIVGKSTDSDKLVELLTS
ncbi:hypothetical protein EW146_g6581 [Bondarzewia mesenterica]|uniref:MI domain-containing protein n=1 Tax=Bondarzewia mesenterica TaxID=1095465 RepID=A0A4S4LN65_9AGAM|nr:hypothetical protein EW146_g6581 [Bondarzewia mesenterica]